MEANVYRSAAAPAGRRFSMSVPKLKVPRVVYYAYVPVIAAGLLLEEWVPKKYVVSGIVASMVVLLAVILYSRERKRVAVEVGPHGISIDAGRGGTFAVEGATLGMWLLPVHRYPAGLALHVTGPDGRRCCIGGRDLRPWPGAPLHAQPVEAVDGCLSREDFADLLPQVAVSLAPVPEAGALRVPLAPNRAFDFLRNFQAPESATLILEIDASRFTVFESTTGAPLASAAASAVQLERAAHTIPGKERGFTMAAVILRAPGIDPIFIGVPDPRFKWPAVAPAAPQPTYLLGSPDWLALVERLGGAETLQVSLD